MRLFLAMNFFLFFSFFKSHLHTQSGAQYGAEPHDPEINTRAEIKSQILNRLSHPGTRQ